MVSSACESSAHAAGKLFIAEVAVKMRVDVCAEVFKMGIGVRRIEGIGRQLL
jgi:hypothetical protein